MVPGPQADASFAPQHCPQRILRDHLILWCQHYWMRGRVRRREFIMQLGGAAAWPLAVCTQQDVRRRRIGFLFGIAESDAIDPRADQRPESRYGGGGHGTSGPRALELRTWQGGERHAHR